MNAFMTCVQQVRCVMEAVEVVVRCNLGVQKMHTYKQDRDIRTLIVDKALRD